MPVDRNFTIGTQGMNVNVSSILLRASEAELLLNANIDVIGKIKKRNGTRMYGQQLTPTTNKNCFGLHQFITAAGVEHRLAAFSNDSNTVIYRMITSTLNGAITTATTTITLASGTNFTDPAGVATHYIEIEGDLIGYTDKATNDLTGVTGITDSHANGTTVRQWIVTTGLTDTDVTKVRFANFLNTVYRVNGSQTMARSADGAAWTNSGGTCGTNCLATLTPSLIERFQERLFVAGDATYPDRLYASSIVSSTETVTWATATHIIDVAGTAGYYIDISPDDGQNIVALKRNSASLLIFKDYSMYIWDGHSTQSDALIDVGTISQETVTNIHNSTFFIGRSQKDLGIYLYNGGYPKNISRKIKKWLDNVTQSTANFATMCVGGDDTNFYAYVGNVAFSNDEIYGTRTFSDVWLVYNIPLDAWVVYDNLPARTFSDLVESGAKKLYFGDNNGKVFEVGNGQTDDNGEGKTPIDFEIITKEETYNDPDRVKELIGMYIMAEKSQNTSVAYRYDRKIDWKGLGNLKRRNTYLDAPQLSDQENIGNIIQYKFVDNSSYQNSIIGYSAEIEINNEWRKELNA